MNHITTVKPHNTILTSSGTSQRRHQHTMTAEPPRTLAFFGASTGIGLAALTRALAAGHTCIALCRKPSKLTDRFPAAAHPNLHVVEGNAHDPSAVSRCLAAPGRSERLVDAVLSSIGGAFIFSKMTLDDPNVCRRGAATLIEAIAAVRQQTGSVAWKPRIIMLSTTGMARAGRDYPLALTPVYRWVLKVPHEDKLAMETAVAEGAVAGQGYTYTIVRPSLLVDEAQPKREVRVGIDDDFVIGYTISRDDTGRWIYGNLLQDGDEIGKYENRIVTITW
ncbi:NAD(P)-binding protein [Hypoxylon sp. FL1150]|nr:NAD(P)-binding protein [Hypoxylon sp. FL1150]